MAKTEEKKTTAETEEDKAIAKLGNGVGIAILGQLGKPKNFERVDSKHLFGTIGGHRFRVNVLTTVEGATDQMVIKQYKIAHTFYVLARGLMKSEDDIELLGVAPALGKIPVLMGN